jgi:hypothetical protein
VEFADIYVDALKTLVKGHLVAFLTCGPDGLLVLTIPAGSHHVDRQPPERQILYLIATILAARAETSRLWS